MKSSRNVAHTPSVLVAAPVYHGCEDFIGTLLAAWQALTYENARFCIVENNVRSDSLHRRLQALDCIRKPGDLFFFFLDNGHLTGWKPLEQAQNQIRRVCLENAFDFLLMNEASRPVPSDIIERLLGYKKQVIGVIYKDSWHPGYYCVYDFDYGEYTHAMERYWDIDRITKPTRVYGIGFGAILISRSVLEVSEFRSEQYAADTYFFERLHELGIPVYAAPVLVRNLRVESDPVMLWDWEQARERIQPGANCR